VSTYTPKLTSYRAGETLYLYMDDRKPVRIKKATGPGWWVFETRHERHRGAHHFPTFEGARSYVAHLIDEHAHRERVVGGGV